MKRYRAPMLPFDRLKASSAQDDFVLDDARAWQLRLVVPSHHVILSLSKDGHATIALPAEI
jgi:hypothetical protein